MSIGNLIFWMFFFFARRYQTRIYLRCVSSLESRTSFYSCKLLVFHSFCVWTVIELKGTDLSFAREIGLFWVSHRSNLSDAKRKLVLVCQNFLYWRKIIYILTHKNFVKSCIPLKPKEDFDSKRKRQESPNNGSSANKRTPTRNFLY